MTKSSKLLDKDIALIAEGELKKLGHYGYVSKKLNAVIAASKHGITEVAKIYDVSRNTISQWVKHVSNMELEKLKAPKDRCKPRKLTEHQEVLIRSWLESDSGLTIEAVRIRIEDVFGTKLGKSTVHRLIKRLNFSYITPRPRHYKQDKKKVEEFKKKSTI